jgi:hypothetical protein
MGYRTVLIGEKGPLYKAETWQFLLGSSTSRLYCKKLSKWFSCQKMWGKITACVYSLLLECRRTSNKFTGICTNVLCFGTRATNQNSFRKMCVMLDVIQFWNILHSYILCKKINSIYSTLNTRAVLPVYIHAAHFEEIEHFA